MMRLVAAGMALAACAGVVVAMAVVVLAEVGLGTVPAAIAPWFLLGVVLFDVAVILAEPWLLADEGQR